MTITFFSLMGFIFLVTLYFQFLKGYGPFSTGVRLLPVATMTGITSVLGTALAVRSSTKLVVTAGLVSLAAGLAWTSTASASTSYLTIAGQMVLIGAGIGLTSAPATESIMGAVPRAKAGVGSAINDATRILGGTLGVAVIGSLYASLYASRLTSGLGVHLPGGAADAADRSVGGALGAADQLAATGHGGARDGAARRRIGGLLPRLRDRLPRDGGSGARRSGHGHRPAASAATAAERRGRQRVERRTRCLTDARIGPWRLAVRARQHDEVAVEIAQPDLTVGGPAGAVRRVAMRRPHHLGAERGGSPDCVVEVVELEPQREAVAVWARRRIADPPVVVLDVEPVQLHHKLAVVNEAFVLVPPVPALAAEQRLIPAAAAFDVADADEWLWTHHSPCRSP